MICLTNWPISINLTNKQHEMETKLHITIKRFTEVFKNIGFFRFVQGCLHYLRKDVYEVFACRNVQEIKHLTNNRLEMTKKLENVT